MSLCCPTGPGTRVHPPNERDRPPSPRTLLHSRLKNQGGKLHPVVNRWGSFSRAQKDIFQVAQNPGGAAASFNSTALLHRSQAAAEVLTRLQESATCQEMLILPQRYQQRAAHIEPGLHMWLSMSVSRKVSRRLGHLLDLCFWFNCYLHAHTHTHTQRLSIFMSDAYISMSSKAVRRWQEV